MVTSKQKTKRALLIDILLALFTKETFLGRFRAFL
jgi:hypothetical protein